MNDPAPHLPFVRAKPGPRPEDLAPHLVDLAHPRLGSRVTYATDDFFAPKERLIDPAPPVFYPDRYDDHGKWMDGWESRRKRTPGHDWCTLRLGISGRIRAFVVDTRFFTGNYPVATSIEGARLSDSEVPAEETSWIELLPRSTLKGDHPHLYAISDDRTWNSLRLHIYPDGGLARLRVFGEIDHDWSKVDESEVVDLVALTHGGRVLGWSDAHFGVASNLIAPGPAANMGDGWETARRRGPGNDWCILSLGHPGIIRVVRLDTAYFKGNYPDRCTLRGARLPPPVNAGDLPSVSESWPLLLPETKLGPDQEHVFERELENIGPVTHLRLDMIPDGGIARLRTFGTIVRATP